MKDIKYYVWDSVQESIWDSTKKIIGKNMQHIWEPVRSYIREYINSPVANISIDDTVYSYIFGRIKELNK